MGCYIFWSLKVSRFFGSPLLSVVLLKTFAQRSLFDIISTLCVSNQCNVFFSLKRKLIFFFYLFSTACQMVHSEIQNVMSAFKSELFVLLVLVVYSHLNKAFNTKITMFLVSLFVAICYQSGTNKTMMFSRKNTGNFFWVRIVTQQCVVQCYG